MHTTSVASITGQFKPGTNRLAPASIASDTSIFKTPHPIMLAVLTIGEIELIRLVAPRAIKAPGSATTAAPYKAENPTTDSPVTAHASKAITAPTTTCAATTRHDESTSCCCRKTAASAALSGLAAGSSSP